VDRCALFVDAGYVLADGAMAVHGTRHRESVSWDYAGLLQFFGSIARERTSLPLLRCYWYEATAEGRRNAEHDTLADLPGLKLRLGRMRPGRREGVEGEIRRDLTTLARNNAISDAVLVSAEEDLSQVVGDVQDLGIRVLIAHITVGGNWTISRSLRQECDDIIEIGEGHLRPYTELVSGTGALRGDDPYQLALPTGRALTNGHGSVVSPLGGHQALAAGSHPAPPAIYTAPVVAEYQRAAQPSPEPGAPSSLPRRPPTSAGEREPGGRAAAGLPDPLGQAGMSGPAPLASPPAPARQDMPSAQRMTAPAQPGQQGVPGQPGMPGHSAMPGQQSLPGQQMVPGQPGAAGQQSTPGQQTMPGQQNMPGHSTMPGQQSMPGQQGRPGQPGMPGQHAPQGGSASPSSPGLPDPRVRGSHAQPAAGEQNGPPGSQPLYAAPSADSFRGPARDVSGPPVPGSPRPAGQGLPGQSQPGQSLPGQGYPAPGSPAGPGTPGPGVPGGQPQYPPGPYGMDPHEQMMSGSPTGPGYAPPHSPYNGPPPSAPQTPVPPGQAMPLPDAVQAAHAEGFEFGQSVAREAPALWLEAVLARKPRMPSDLEARLLQDSALPIDSLLHDETRQALRRGFWDALERSRR
jgi:hypothetical protein